MLAGFLVALLLQGATQAPVRDVPRAAPGAAVIRGRVVAAATDQPLHRVRITLNAGDPNAPAAVTDTDGRFEVTNVSAGTYSLTASRSGYLTIQYGQRRPRERGRSLEIKDGEVVDGINLALYRGAVLSGRVLDESGDPAPGVRVEAIEARYIRGQRMPVAAKIAPTNDAGEYRLNGLNPGTYQIRASTSDVWESDDGKATYVHAITTYPDAVTVGIGQEVSGLEVKLIAGRAARIAGVLLDANDQPMPGQVVNLDTILRTTGGDLLGAGFGGSAKTDAAGRFEIDKLVPGEYNAYGGLPSDRVSVQVAVGDGETKQITLAARRSVAAAGRVVAEGGTPLPFAASRISIEAVAVDPPIVLPMWAAPRPQPPRPDWTFRLTSLEGPQLFRVSGLPAGWRLAAVKLGDRDYIDTPMSFARGMADVEGLQLVLTQSGGSLAGEVVDPGGAPVPDVTVIAFAENRGLWGTASRFIKIARPDAKGHFAIEGLPPGVYRIVARDAVVEGQWENPEFLQRLADSAMRVELSEGRVETVKLTFGGR